TAWLAVFVLAGCSAPADAPDPAQLADFAACHPAYPDGTPVPCRDEAQAIHAASEAPTAGDGWVCQEGQGGYASYGRPDDAGHIGARYPPLPVEGPIHGLFTIESADAAQSLHAWEAGPGGGFVDVRRADGTGPNAGVVLYDVAVESDRPELAATEPRFLWTLWQGHPWLVLEFATASGTYWFSSMVGFVSDLGTTYAPAHLDLQGADFRLAVRFWSSGGYGFGSPSPDLACTLLGPDGPA
ncbi:MAG TPA: hypothetical protein VJ874_01640, partial [Candidatus Thermoplasmatota archaeon]|nr:hypothetical protein [Candidatus Thermoplasmatota archaeon]